MTPQEVIELARKESNETNASGTELIRMALAGLESTCIGIVNAAAVEICGKNAAAVWWMGRPDRRELTNRILDRAIEIAAEQVS